MLKMVLAGVVGLLFFVGICAAEVILEHRGDSEDDRD